MPLSWIILKLSLNYVFFFSVYSNVFLFLNVFLISSWRVSQSFWLFQSGLVDSQPCYTGQCLPSSPKRSLAPLSRLHPPFPGTPVLRFLDLNLCCGVSSSSSLLKKRQRESLCMSERVFHQFLYLIDTPAGTRLLDGDHLFPECGRICSIPL